MGKSEIRISKYETISNVETLITKNNYPIKYDLEERTEKFAREIILLCKQIHRDTINIELVSQLIRSSGSVGANYIEANESVSKKDFSHRIKICRKEAKESRYWLKLLISANIDFKEKIAPHIQEATELMNIFGAIVKKCL
ncbi:MAG: four helix bundle protein [Candidatus Omnitrophota bacterium]|nr:four helix bundle protein [Candidatus Omnitrophota bacterium]